MVSDKIFADGIFFKTPRDGAPDFVKGMVSIKLSEALPFLQANDNDGWVNLDLKKSKGGKLYLELNNWNPKGEKPAEGGLDSDIPF